VEAAALTSKEAPRALLVLVVVLLLQLTVVLDIRVAGAHPDLILGLAVAAGLAGGTERGAIVGFFSGLALDLFLPTPFGLSALVGIGIGTAAGRLVAAGVDRTNWLFVPGVAAVGSAIGVIMFAVLGAVLGQPDTLTVGLGAAVGVVTVVNGALGYLLVRACNWAFGQEVASSAWRGSLVPGDRP
jgi:rod shape-determining protein MreD